MSVSLSISLFRGSNFIEFMWLSFALSQCFGLLPYKISRGTKLSSSIIGYVYASAVLTFLTISIITLGYYINFTSSMNYDSVPGIIQCDCYFLLGYLYCLSSFIRSGRKLNLFNKLSKISHLVEKSKWNKYAVIIHSKDLIGFLFLVAQTPNSIKGNHSDIVFKLIGCYITIVIFLLDNQILNCILATKFLFKSINSELELLEYNLISNREFDYMADKFIRDGKKLNSLTEIRSLRKKYEDLCEIVKITNDTFSMPIIISLGLTFAEVTFSLYFYILQSIGAKEINLEKQIWYFYFITSAAYYSSKFLVAVWTCETTEDEAQRSKVIVHRILTRLYDKDISQELQSFSLQMVQREISFSAHGISLNGSLVSRVAGGISTYFLILIQFLITSKQCDNYGE